MRIRILVRRPLRRWQETLAAALREDGHETYVEVGSRGEGLSVGVELSLRLQRHLFGPRRALFAPVPFEERAVAGAFDLVVALNGEPPDAGCWIVPLFDGVAGDTGLIGAAARGTAPHVVLRQHAAGGARDLVVGRFAVEDRDVVSRALDQLVARLVTVIRQAVRRTAAPDLPEIARAVASDQRGANRHPLAAMARGAARKLAGRLPGASRGPNHWQIGYRVARQTGQDADPVSGSGLGADFAMLPDDGARFYADPMPFAHDGRRFLFFEDFPYATGKGVIGYSEIAPDGTASTPCTVLEQPVHLSYPYVIDHAGAIFMMPEMSAARRLQLFRADPFPDRWIADRVLLEGIAAADATPVLHEGRWWIFAALSDDGGSSWDQLGLFHAPDLFGPWRPHRDNPVLIDAGAARPAGAMWHEGAALMRIAQDCRDGYGRGLTICRVDRLDPDGFAQTIVSRLGPPAGGADGIHTWNRSVGLDVIDLRFPPMRRRDATASDAVSDSRRDP